MEISNPDIFMLMCILITLIISQTHIVYNG